MLEGEQMEAGVEVATETGILTLPGCQTTRTAARLELAWPRGGRQTSSTRKLGKISTWFKRDSPPTTKCAMA